MRRVEQRSQALIIIQLCLMVLVGRVAFDIYIPALPTIQHELQSNSGQIGLTISLFTLGFGLSQLFYGPLSDRYGRRLVLLFGFLIFIFGSSLAYKVSSITELDLARFIMGCGAGVGVVISRAIARDLFKDNALAKVCATQTLVLTLGLFAAPLLGGYLLTWFGWRSDFIVLIVLGFVCLGLFLFYLPETNKQTKANRSLLVNVKHYGLLVADRHFMLYACVVGLSFSGLVAYLQLGTFIFQQHFLMSAKDYGWLTLFIVAAYIIGTVSMHYELKTKTLHKIVEKGSWLMSVSGVIMLVGVFTEFTPISMILFSTMLYVYGLRLIMPTATSLCLSPFAKNAGTAAALLGAIIMVISSAVSYLLTLFHAKPIMLLGGVYLVLGILCCVLVISSRKEVDNA